MKFNVQFKSKPFPSPKTWSSLKKTCSAKSDFYLPLKVTNALERERKGENAEIYRPNWWNRIVTVLSITVKSERDNKTHREGKSTQGDTARGNGSEHQRQGKMPILQKLPGVLHTIASRRYHRGTPYLFQIICFIQQHYLKQSQRCFEQA